MMLALRPINLSDPVERTIALMNRMETVQVNDGHFRFLFNSSMKTVEDYQERLRVRQEQNALYASFAILNGEIVGQLEMFENDVRPGTGYINHIFISEQQRGKGLGRQLLALAENQLAVDGYPLVTLSSAKNNEQTYRFYQACGWTCLGGRPDKPEKLYLWEKKLTNA